MCIAGRQRHEEDEEEERWFVEVHRKYCKSSKVCKVA